MTNTQSETGSAPVEFLGFGIPMIFIILIGSHLLISGYLSNVALDAANEGAQALAYDDGSTQAARDKVQRVFSWLAPSSTFEMDSTSTSQEGLSVAQVNVRVPNPFAIGSGQLIIESASVIDESN